MPAQLDQQQKHSTPFADSFSNPMGQSGNDIQVDLSLSFVDKHYVKKQWNHYNIGIIITIIIDWNQL